MSPNGRPGDLKPYLQADQSQQSANPNGRLRGGFRANVRGEGWYVLSEQSMEKAGGLFKKMMSRCWIPGYDTASIFLTSFFIKKLQFTESFLLWENPLGCSCFFPD